MSVVHKGVFKTRNDAMVSYEVVLRGGIYSTYIFDRCDRIRVNARVNPVTAIREARDAVRSCVTYGPR